MRRLRKSSNTATITDAGLPGSASEGFASDKFSNASSSNTSAAAISRRKFAMDGTLSAEVWKNFEKIGRNEFVKFIRHHLKDGNSPIFTKTDEFKVGISSALYDLLWHGIRSTFKRETLFSTLQEIVALHNDFSSVILDIVNILDAETSLMTDGIQEERVMFCQIVKSLDKVIPEALIKERLEIDTLQEVGIVKNKVFYTKFIKIKTKLYYKQRRFNLFREESEGYAKLITELNQDFEDDVTPTGLMDIIKSLIGGFNLDPNRVLDIIIESFESRSERCALFVPLLRTYMPNSTIISEVLGYKFRYFSGTKTPHSLFHVCALLLKYAVIKLSDVYIWLSPTDKTIITEWEKELCDEREVVRKMNVIVTNKDKEPIEVESDKDSDEDKYSINQKFELCEALLRVGDWENALNIIKRLPEQSVVVHEPIARALADLIHISIDYVYTKKCFKPQMTRPNLIMDDAKVVQKIQAKDFSELRNYAFQMMTTLGPSMHYDTVLMYKVIRIMRAILTDMGIDSLNTPSPNTESETLYYEVMTIMDAAILPSLSYLDCNCPMAEEIWSIFKFYPYHYRYSLYARWKNDTYQLHPQLIRRRGIAQKNIKALMKRVSKENVKPVGRLIGKLSHCAPGFLFEYILLQIQIYDNLIGPVVDSLKYLTSLSFDCLGYCLIEALALADRDRFKHDGTSISMWLQSLACFCGAIFKKYNIELSGLLQFVANQLKSQKSLDLLILKEIVQKMSGVESAEEMTNEHLNAMCGGELLRGEAGYFSQVRNTKKSSQRLKEALANNDLAVTICLLMAQQKHCVIYRETAQSHLKLVGKLYDQCQDTLVQFGTFLGSTYSVDEYVERLPSIIVMLQEYHINADVAFFLARPMFSHQINQKYDQLRRADPNSKKLTTSQKLHKYLEATNLIMSPIVESVRPLHGAKVWEDISPQFLVTFWSLSMYDLQVPAESYQKEISKLKVLAIQAIDTKESNASKNKKEQERYIALMDKLQDERKKQQEHVDKILQRLQQQKDNWFLSRSAKSAKNETITQFLQLCLFPRCTFTALDALYCAKFVHTIHNLKAANFSTLLCYDRIFCDITYSVTSCTENEATRYGRFLCALLETVMRWHSDQATFNKECANYPGFVTKFRVSNQFSEANDHVGYENYRHVCHKWHYKITKAIVFCLDSKDYMQIRNALIILMRVLPFYPVLSKLGQIIERKVEKVREEEKNKRPDLFVIASSYIGQLKNKSSQMIKESDFHQVTERVIKADQQPVAIGNVVAASASNNIAVVAPGNYKPTPVPLTEVCNGSTSPKYSMPSTAMPTTSPSTRQISYAEHKTDKRERDHRTDKSKILKLITNERDREQQSNLLPTASTSSATAIRSSNVSSTSEIRDEAVNLSTTTSSSHDRSDHDRLPSSSSSTTTSRSAKEAKKDDRSRDRERDRDRDRDRLERDVGEHLRGKTEETDDGGGGATSSSSRLKREKRREERYRTEPSTVDAIDMAEKHDHDYDRPYDRERDRISERTRDRDLSSVSNESNASLHRRNQDVIEYEKDSKRRKMESSSNSKKYSADDSSTVQTKKERIVKPKDRKEKLTDEEKDARKERKLGRKRERLEDNLSVDQKRRRDVQNGDDDIRDRDRYHSRDKSPHVQHARDRSHDRFDRERGSREERQYNSAPKSSRSRMGY